MRDLPAILDTLQEAGADLIEVGLPFSDPIADGPVIQAANQRALEHGATPRGVLETLKGAPIEIPVVLMGYYNPVLRYGLDAFAQAAASAGASATIITDLTPEESEPWVASSRAHGLDNVFLAAPTSTDARLDEVCKRASGFVYAVSRTGVTGHASEVPADVSDLVQRVKQRTPHPVCVGFGISKPEHVRMVCEVADGAVIGSWLVRLLAQNWSNGAGRQLVLDAVSELKEATRR